MFAFKCTHAVEVLHNRYCTQFVQRNKMVELNLKNEHLTYFSANTFVIITHFDLSQDPDIDQLYIQMNSKFIVIKLGA